VSGDLDGRVAVVTGAGRGMGEAIARMLAGAGAKVIASDLDPDAAEDTAGKIVADGGVADAVRCDVAAENEVEALVAAAVSAYGRLDCAVNNAAIPPDRGAVVDIDPAVWRRVIDVNLTSVAWCLKHELRQLVRQGEGGSLVNLGSVASARPRALNPAYVAAKHGVLGLTKVAAVEHGPDRIRVNAILPGGIDTPMLRHSRAEYGGKVGGDESALSLFGRLGTTDEIAEAALWLCSDRSSFVTGHGLAVDAGYLAR
jgi:NAD(P)-dependent dehydrogenase (short-subunit alcohol dehydrogenase family)